ncbi:MAG TPA: carbohydrate kinase [Marmoricola sp.]|nr:carbohydrate kinase [Marmoricola sp.]
MTVVVVGESLIDVVVDIEGDTVVEAVGGSPLNVALALARLEVPAVLITQTGHDEYGGRIADRLTGSGTELVRVPTSSGRTATATARLAADGSASYVFDLDWSLPHQELPACDVLHVGSLGATLEPGRDSVLDLVDQAYARGVFVSYDPNVRPHFVDDRRSTWRDLEALADRAQLVKLSEEDVEALHPGADPGDIARSLLSGERTELVLLTRGGEGASAYAVSGSAELVVDLHAPPTTLVDTIGAGDAFMAGALAVLLEAGAVGDFGAGMPDTEDSLEHLLQAAMQVASVTCSRRGAEPPTRSELPEGWPG